MARLCPQCGLCCNGALFADVKLQLGDHPDRLAALGLPLRQRAGRHRLPQPCPAFDGQLCRIYPDRPLRCRDFECGLLKRLQSGALSFHAATQSLRQALEQLQAVEAALDRAGAAAPNQPLTWRYRRAMARPLDLSLTKEDANRHGRLLLAMHQLMKTVHQHFLAEC